MVDVRAFPNPFNAAVELRLELPGEATVRITIHDLRGRLVARVTESTLARGTHGFTWHGRDGAGADVASGVYMARVAIEDRVRTLRIALVK